MDNDKTLLSLIGLILVGAIMGIGQVMVSSKEVVTIRLAVGRAILGAGTSLIAGVVLIQIPDIHPLALLGIGSMLGIIGQQYIEALLKRKARRLFGEREGGGL